MRRHFFRHVIFLFVAFCLTSCGFHLRGSEPINPELKNLYLKTAYPYDQLTHNLEAYLKMSGVNLTSTPESANYVLDILKETESQDLISVSGTQQTRQYNLVLTVEFQMTKPNGKVVMPPLSISKTTVFTMQANQILGGSNEEMSMYQQMRQDIVYDIMNRISSLEVLNMLQEAKKPHPIKEEDEE